MLNKEELLKRNVRSVKKGKLPDGTLFYVRKLPAADVLGIFADERNREAKNYWPALAQVCLCDKDGKRELSDSEQDRAACAGLPLDDLQAIAETAMAFNRLDGADEEKKDEAA